MQSAVPVYFYDAIIVFAALAALSFTLQAAILVGFFVAFVKLRGKLETILNHLTEHALPLISSTKATVDELTPKIKTISGNLAEISETLKQESQHVKASVDDVLSKTRVQTARVDGMVSGTLDGITQAAGVIQQGIEVPLRQIHGVFNGVKAAFETLRERPSRADHRRPRYADEVPFKGAATVDPPVVMMEEVLVTPSEPIR